MRYFATALILGFTFLLTGAGDARAGTWCAWYDPYTYNCGFNTFQQCQATVLGAGGYCARNVYESTAPGPRPRRAIDGQSRRP
jgi:Protein of unknown function (DUF3551)